MTKLTASDAANNDYFGSSVAISVDTVVVGAWGKTARAQTVGRPISLSATRAGPDNWGQAGKLTASDAPEW